MMRPISRALVLCAMVSVACAVLPPGAAAAAASPEVSAQVERLMERSGLREQISDWKQWMGQNAAELRQNEELPRRNREIAAQVIERMFDPALVIKRVEHRLAVQWSAEDGAHVFDFLDTDLGRRLTAWEVASGDIASKEAEQAWQARLADAPPPEARIALMVELDRTTWASQVAVETWTLMSTTSALALAAAGRSGSAPSPEQMEAVRQRMRAQLGEPIRQEVLLSMLFTYRDASDADLRAYIEFHESAAGQWYRKAVSSAMLQALSETAAEAARQIRHQVAL